MTRSWHQEKANVPGWKAGAGEGSWALSPCCLSRGKCRVPWGTRVPSQHGAERTFHPGPGVRTRAAPKTGPLPAAAPPRQSRPVDLTGCLRAFLFGRTSTVGEPWRAERFDLPSEVGSMEAGLECRIWSRRPCGSWEEPVGSAGSSQAGRSPTPGSTVV